MTAWAGLTVCVNKINTTDVQITRVDELTGNLVYKNKQQEDLTS